MAEKNVLLNESEGYRRKSQFVQVMKRLLDNKKAVIGLIVIACFIVLAIIADFIVPYSMNEMTSDILVKPNARHLFGTDDLGRDLFSRVICGTKYSIVLGVGATLIGAVAGTAIGSVSGYYGGIIDETIMRLTDVIQSIPGVLFNMALAVAFGGGFFNTMVALGVAQIAGTARLMRSSILNVRKMEYIDAASSVNCNDFRKILKHIIPNALSPILVRSTMSVGTVIMSAAGLSFLGLGLPVGSPEWGALLSSGRDYIKNYPHMTLIPGIFLLVFVLAINLTGDSLRDALDPKLKK
ncbi:MAG: ABC transporter permease [Clostridiaceae bacterium]|nr:ABC transporter permease [Clostridiaceae bacterium]